MKSHIQTILKLTFVLVVLFISCSSTYSQFPASLVIESNGNLLLSPKTEQGVKYRITVEGSYSMWPQFIDCHGVDAVYVYDVPKEEIDNLRWPPLFVFPLPIWVGDTTGLSLPNLTFSMRKHKGFRIDGEPLPNSGLDNIKHRYQIEKIGTGDAFQFQILDSNYNIIQEKMIGRYEDNCGSLKVIIEKIDTLAPDINICDIKTICDKNRNIIGVQLWASIFETDTTNPKNRKNLLQSISLDQIGIVENGRFKCDIDSIICGLNVPPIAVGLLIDRSGSMDATISDIDMTIRMDASKNAISKFVDNLKNNDSAFLMSFSDSLTLNYNWSSNKDSLKLAINNIQTKSMGRTAFNDALIRALEKTSYHKNPLRSIIVLTDGANNLPPYWGDSIKTIIRNFNIPIYIVSLGFSSDSTDQLGRNINDTIAEISRGKNYNVYDSKQLDSIYKKLSQTLSDDECCAIFFKIDSCSPGQKHFVRLIYSPKDTVIISKVISFYCDSCGIISAIPEINENNRAQNISQVQVNPNPFDEYSIINFVINSPGQVNIDIVDLFGNKWSNFDMGYQNIGDYKYIIDGSKLPSGTYLVVVTKDGYPVSRKIIVLH